MIVRKLTKEEYDKHFKVSAMSFIWSYDGKEDEPKYEILATFDDDNETLFAQLEILRFETSYFGKFLPAIGIGGVASMPEYRNKGAVRALFQDIEKTAAEQNIAIGYLSPFSTDYYKKFGYDHGCRQVELSCPIKFISKYERPSRITLYEGSNMDELLALYNEFAIRRKLMLKRKDNTYFPAEPYKQQKYTYIWRYENGKAGAYATFSVDRPTSSLNVEEFVYLDREAAVEMLGFLRAYEGQVETLNISKLDENSPVIDLIAEHNKIKLSLKFGMAARIYDIKTILENNIYPEKAGKFALLSNDSIPMNDGIFVVEYENGKAVVTKNDKNGEYDIAVNETAAVNLLLCGGYTNETAPFVPGVEIKNSCDDFFTAFPKKPSNFFCGF